MTPPTLFRRAKSSATLDLFGLLEKLGIGEARHSRCILQTQRPAAAENRRSEHYLGDVHQIEPEKTHAPMREKTGLDCLRNRQDRGAGACVDFPLAERSTEPLRNDQANGVDAAGAPVKMGP